MTISATLRTLLAQWQADRVHRALYPEQATS